MGRSYKSDFENLDVEHRALLDKYSTLKVDLDKFKIEIDESKNVLTTALTNYNQFEQKVSAISALQSKYDGKFESISNTVDEIEETDGKLETQLTATTEELTRLRRLNNRANKLLGKASSYSLSSSFESRRSDLEKQAKSQKCWFNGCVVVISILIIVIYLRDTPADFKDGILFFLKSISLTSPLIWAASSFSRNHYESVQLEEFYAQKVAVALAYTGYKEEIEMLSKESEDFKALLQLMQENLGMIAKPSDGIFSKESDQHLYQKFLDKLIPN